METETQITKNQITLPTNTILPGEGLVILQKKEYEDLCRKAVPTMQLTGKDAEKLDKLVEEGLKDYREGKCKKINSLADLD